MLKRFKNYKSVNENINYADKLGEIHWAINTVYDLLDNGYITDKLELKENLNFDDVMDDEGNVIFDSSEELETSLNEVKRIISWLNIDTKYD